MKIKKSFALLCAVFTAFMFLSCAQGVNQKKELLTVTAEDDGLYFEVNHKKEADRLFVKVFDLEEKRYNLELFYNVTDGSTSQKLFYPYVTAGKSYYIILFTENSSSPIDYKEVNVTATGGLGDYTFTCQGMTYDSNKTVQFQNLKKIAPDSEKDNNYSTFPMFYYGSTASNPKEHYSGDGETFSSISADTGKIELSDNAVNSLQENKYFFLGFQYQTKIEDSDATYFYNLIDSNYIFEYQKECNYLNSSDNIIYSKYDSEGLQFFINSNYNSSISKIYVKDTTANVTCPTLITTYNGGSFKYPFTITDHTYKIYTDTSNSVLEFTAKGGSGNAYNSYTSAEYKYEDNSGTPKCSVVLNDYNLVFPADLTIASGSVNGTIYYTRDTASSYSQLAVSFLSFTDGTINISKYFNYIRHSQFYADLYYSFTCSDVSYELNLINNKDNPFEDTNELPKVLKDDYQELMETGTYTVDDSQKDKAAFLIKFNSSTSSLTDSADIDTTESSNIVQRAAVMDELSALEEKNGYHKILCGTQIEELELGDIVQPSQAAARTAVSTTDDYSSYVVDKTTKTFSSYDATLKATGDHCNVWYYNNNDTADEVLTAAINDSEKSETKFFQGVADRFDGIFNKETYLVGSNVPEKQYSNIITVSDSTKIDIFIFDIGGDYTTDDTGGTYGYFSPSDLYTQKYYSSSNACEMLYLDSAFLGKDPGGMYSTLAHEFQHLLLQVNKSLNKSLNYDTWFTEFMSLASEDVMKYHIEDSDGIDSRVWGFNTAYYLGFEKWSNDDDSVIYNYSNAAIFADFLMKNYGGVDLFYEIAHNDYVGEESIEAALSALGYSETFESVMKKFGISIVFAGAAADAVPDELTVNKTVSSTYTISGEAYTFKLDPIDYSAFKNRNSLYENSYSYDQWNGDDWYGPLILKETQNFGSIYGRTIGVKYLGTNQSSYVINDTSDDFQLAIVFTSY